MERTIGEPAVFGPALVGRTHEITSVKDRIETACSGARQIVLVQGPPGIGKTSLLRAALDSSELTGATVLRAWCHEISADTPYGVVRELVKPLGLTSSDAAHASVLHSGARWALPALLPRADDVAPHDPSHTYALMHGLYWLAVNLMTDGPLVLVIDDVHWSDERSMHWLGYLLGRTEGMPLCVALTVRTPVVRALPALLGDILTGDDGLVLTLRPLDEQDVEAVVETGFGRTPSERFLSACHELSGGNPLLLSRLLGGVHRRGLHPDDDALPVLAEVGQDVVASSVLGWVATQPEHVRRVVQAVAVLESTDADLVAALSRVPVRTVESVLKSSRRNDILSSDVDGFSHDLVRTSLIDDLRPEEHERLRDRAARLLSDAGCPAEEVAGQLLPRSRLREPWMRTVLSDAANDASRRGAPEAALRYLSLLLGVTPDDVGLRVRLAVLLAQTDPATALNHLRNALDLTTDVRSRARIAVRFGMTALAVQQSPRAVAVLGSALDALRAEIGEQCGPADHELLTHVQSTFLISGLDEKSTVCEVHERVSTMTEPAGNTPAERQLLAMMAVAGTMRGESPSVAVRRANHALLLDDDALGGWSMIASAFVLDIADQVPAALRAVDRAITQSRAQAAAWNYCLALSGRSILLNDLGDFNECGADAQLALEVAEHEARCFDVVQPVVGLAVPLVHCGEAARAEALLDGITRSRLDDFVVENHYVAMARALVRAHLGDTEGALDHLRRCGRSLAEAGITNPLFVPWWAEAALLLADSGRATEAVELVEHGEHLTKSWDVPRARGLALMTRAVVGVGTAAVELLEEAVRVLEGSSARYDHQRAEHLLGRELLRHGDERTAREHLRRAVDLATRCGSTTAAAQSRDLLVKAGGRMRQVPGSRVDALTGSERRVAVMAGDGQTNRDIAEALFVTPRTVEQHLTSVYRKLGINGRGELLAVLAQERRRRPGSARQCEHAE